MRVPVRRQPETRVSDQQLGYARGVQPLDLSPLTSVIEGFRDQLLEEQDDRQRVELNRRLLQEVNDLQGDFEERRRNPEISPIDFADSTNAAYTERHTALLEELRQQRYNPDLIADLEGRLGTVRQGFYERGLGHQIQQLRSRAVEQTEDIGRAASQYTAANPDGYATARDMVIDSIRTNPDLMEDERAQLEDQTLATVRDAGAAALAIQNPQMIINLFDPQGLTAPHQPASSTPSGVAAVNTEGLDSDRTAVATTLSAGGLSPQVVAGFLGNFDVEGGYSGALGDGGTASGIAQWRQERRNNFRRQFGKDPHQATLQEQAQFVLWELENPSAAGMTQEQATAIRNASTPEEAARLIDQFYERSSGEHRSRRIQAASRYATVQTVDIPPSTSPQQNNPASETQADTGGAAVEDEAGEPDISRIVTGNPLLDDLTGVERLQLLGRAREQMNRRLASQKAEMDVRIGNITAEAMNNGGEIATPIPTEQEVLNIYGPVEGPQRWAQIQQSQATGRAITTFRTRSAEDIQRSLDELEPDPGSPTYATELQIYESAQRAATALLEERERDPAAYAMKYFPSLREAAQQGTQQYYAELDRVYETLGIDSRTASVMSAAATEQLTEEYRGMTPTQRRDFLRQNMAQMGEERFRRFAGDMEGTTVEGDARIFALLRTYPGRNGEVGNVFNQVLEGREIIAQDPARRPSPEAVRQQFRTEGLEAIRNLNAEASLAIQEAAEALYVVNGGDPVNINPRLYREALRVALGGSLPADMRHGAVRDYTILPARTNERQFQAWIERQTMASLTNLSVERRPPRYGDLRTPVPVSDIIDEGVFVMVSPGRYMIKMGSDGRPLMTSTGRPFLVNIHARNVIGGQ